MLRNLGKKAEQSTMRIHDNYDIAFLSYFQGYMRYVCVCMYI